MKKTMKDKIFLILKIIIGIMIVVAVVNFLYNKYQEELLKNELEEIARYDINTDSFNTKLKTSNSYAKVENAIKSYLNDYSLQLKKINDLKNNQQLKGVLSAANYSSDGPAFVNTSAFLVEFSENFNSEVEKLEEFRSGDVTNKYIDLENVSKYYKSLYEKYISSSVIQNEINSSIEEVNKTKESINNIILGDTKVIEFLKSSTWTIRNDGIIFSSEDDLNTYNELIKNIIDNT